MKKENIIWISLSVIIGSILIGVSPNNSKSNTEITNLQNKLNSIVSNTKNKINDNTTTDTYLKDTTFNNLNNVSKDLMKNLYTWSDGKSYNQNKEQIINNDVSSADLIRTIMPDAKDTSGESQIDALNLTSNLESTNIYISALDSENATIVAKATASKTGESSTLSNNYVYTIHYNPSINKIDNIQYVGKESLNTSTGNYIKKGLSN